MTRKRKVGSVAGTAALLAAMWYWLTNTWSGTVVFPDGSRGDFWTPWWVQVVACVVVGITAGCATSILALAFTRKSAEPVAAPDSVA